MRETLKAIYKGLMIFVTAALAIGTVAAWWSATPGNGLLLVSGILVLLTLMAGLSINKLDWRDRQAESRAELGRGIREKLPFSMRLGGDGRMQWNLREGAASVQYAEPEVRRVDLAMLDEVKHMAAAGAPIDEICRLVDPGHGQHDPVHQEAFRKMVRAMIEQG